ncbi:MULTISPECIES: hypothetical protein [unclassified Nonomuraea]
MAIVEALRWMVRRAGMGDVAGLVQLARRTASVADEPDVTNRLNG